MEKENWLDLELKKYAASDAYPFHMPGHKRHSFQKWGEFLPEEIDITEIEGFDNLHHARGILADAQRRMAETFGVFRSFFLVNGSTAGLLSAICAAAPKGSRILMARNCHKAVYHAVYLQELKADYLYPMETEDGIQGSIDPADVKRALQKTLPASAEETRRTETFPSGKDRTGSHPAGNTSGNLPETQGRKARSENTGYNLYHENTGHDRYHGYAAVILTSPTYDGTASDIAAIAEIVHSCGIPLIVDEAHGAHFGFSALFPKKAAALGADYCIESLHKTLPAYTQSAVLHIADSPFVNEKRLERYLQIFQSSSPSYVLMAGMDRCTRILRESGAELFGEFEENLSRFYEDTRGLQNLEVLPAGYGRAGIWYRDPSKILVSGRKAGLSGEQLMEILRRDFHLEMEMAAGETVTALTSLMDTPEGFRRLRDALLEIDRIPDEECAGETGSARKEKHIGETDPGTVGKCAGKTDPGTTGNRARENDPGTAGKCAGKTDLGTTGNRVRENDPGTTGKTDSETSEKHVKEADAGTFGRHGGKEKISSIYRISGQNPVSMPMCRAMEAPASTLPLEKAAGCISAEFVYLYPPGIPLLVPGEKITADLVQALQECLRLKLTVIGVDDGKIAVVRRKL